MKDRIIKAIKSFFAPYWQHLTRNVYRDAWLNGMDTGYLEAHRDLLELLLDKRADVVAVRDSAKDNSTKAGGDGMILGFELALGAVGDQLKDLQKTNLDPVEEAIKRLTDRTPF